MSRAYRLLGAGRAEMVDVPRPEPGPDEVLLRVPCSRGEYNVCRDVVSGAIGITRDGGMADHVVVPARNLVAVGDVDPVHAAPLTDAGMTALHAVERARALLEPVAAAGCRSPRGWEPAMRPTARSRSCTPSAEPLGISRRRSRSPTPAASGRTSRSTTSRPPVGCLQIWTPGTCSGAPCSCLEERRVSCRLM